MISSRLINPQSLLSLFGEFPKLENLRFRKIEIDEETSTLQLSIATTTMPINVPKRWNRNELKFIEIEFHFFGGKYSIGREGEISSGTIEIQDLPDCESFSLRADFTGLRITGEFSDMWVAKISPLSSRPSDVIHSAPNPSFNPDVTSTS